MTENVGEFVYNKRDLIGHGAFAVVFKGHHRKVKAISFSYLHDIFKLKQTSQGLLSERTIQITISVLFHGYKDPHFIC